MATEAFSSDSPPSNFTFTHMTHIQREENNGFLAPRNVDFLKLLKGKSLREMLEYNVKSVVDSKNSGDQEEKNVHEF